MDIEVITFPALVVADDGWVQQLENKEGLSTVTRAALKKYGKRHMILYDSRDQAWQVDGFVPLERGNALSRLLGAIFNAKVGVRAIVSPITESPLETARAALMGAIDADDDILTQFTNASELKSAIGQAQSFKDFVTVLRSKRAI